QVGYNVVGRCGGDGIQLTTGGYGCVVSVQNNTVFGDRGSGFTVHSELYADVTLRNNIASGNGEYGLLSTGSPPVTNCNDWYANGMGAVGGMDPSGADLIVDPGFCDPATGDGHLRCDSPLYDAPRCGQIGARGVACDAPLWRFHVGPNQSSGPVGI